MTECDLPEYCNGTSAECPADVYKQDGMPCSKSNRCFLGDCLDLQKHCVALFGKGKAGILLLSNIRMEILRQAYHGVFSVSKLHTLHLWHPTFLLSISPLSLDIICFSGPFIYLVSPALPSLSLSSGAQEAPLSCFKKVNMRGDQSGNCGGDGEKFKKCDKKDILCGRLQCVHIKKIPKVATGQSVIQTPVGNTLCWGTEFHPGQGAPDFGAVKDGTTCGTGKMCINRSCIGLDFMKHSCNYSKCNHRGVCNNNGNCHCSYGWAPPFCLGRGYGGSIESGPPAAYEEPLVRVVVFVVLGGLALFLLGLAAAYKRDPLKAWFAKAIRRNLFKEPYDTESMGSSSLKPQEGKLDLTSPT
nr:PREDICTED: disintegrin and metalloproteinase domain-containing protein 30 [Anolis carolinensis]|eukprot:XP_008119913.2 PREDICTED: disintegrin and metalloproteinase domain-containing protein 30 [Anolis carolinensis]